MGRIAGPAAAPECFCGSGTAVDVENDRSGLCLRVVLLRRHGGGKGCLAAGRGRIGRGGERGPRRGRRSGAHVELSDKSLANSSFLVGVAVNGWVAHERNGRLPRGYAGGLEFHKFR